MTQVLQNLPTLFIRNISKNTTKEVVWNTIANLGFGTISNVILNVSADTAIVYYEYWNMDQTEYIRRMLASNKTLNISYDYESSPWVVSQYDDTFTFGPPQMLPNGIKHRKIKKDTRCYAPKKAPREKTYVIEDNVCKNLFPFPHVN